MLLEIKKDKKSTGTYDIEVKEEAIAENKAHKIYFLDI